MNSITAKRLFKIIILIAADMLCAASAVFLGASMCFSEPASDIWANVGRLLAVWLSAHVCIFAAFRLYNRLWEYASLTEAIRVAAASLCSFAAMLVIGAVMGLGSYGACCPTVLLLLTAFTLGTRFFYRLVSAVGQYNVSFFKKGKTNNIMIIGAGHAGNALIRETERDRIFAKFRVVCLIDDDPAKLHRYIGGAKVVGGRGKIVWAAKKYGVDEIIFAIPSAESRTRREFYNICMKTSCVIKTLPSYYQMVSGKIKAAMLRKVEITDLLEREQVLIELDRENDYIHGKRVLVTGAGGSIGSELCRQLAMYSPAMLIALDEYENGVFYVQNELRGSFPELKMITLIGSICDADRLNFIFSQYRPEIVYHAAAHKHVPLMEENPDEAVKNNVFGTLNAAYAADKFGVSRFVMISTDKAVNPTSVMGATKRICEMIVQYYDVHSDTDFVAVRFGNVMGSNGSVFSIFGKQIENGGPVTVTHPEIIRYFMTIPEAVSLVLQAGAYSRTEQMFVLDMGDPVKVLSLAENMIKLSGHIPYKEIGIEFTGLRPGEKIFEELHTDGEEIAETQNRKIFAVSPADFDEEAFLVGLCALEKAAGDESRDIRALISEIVPTYRYRAYVPEKTTDA